MKGGVVVTDRYGVPSRDVRNVPRVALFKRARALRLSCSLFLLSRFVLYQF